MDEIPEDDGCNSEEAIALAGPVAERWRDALTVALASTPGQEWRSVDMQVAFLTGAIAEVIDRATIAERERCMKLMEALKADSDALSRLRYPDTTGQ